MHISTITSLLLAATANAAYVLKDDYAASSFASMFDFWTGNDPTNGYVNYIPQSQAESAGLYKVVGNQVYMGVDSTNVASGRGRDSIRISSKQVYNHGLIILDLAHMPGGQCGTWPAFWTLGADWPNNGEVDIIEGVNSQQVNTMAMHTNAGCTITNTGLFSDVLQTDDCDVNAPDQAQNAGCSIRSTKTNSYGTGFNNGGGGVYATQWTSEAINIWFFPRGAIPSDITSGSPDPSGWGIPQGRFAGGCDIDSKLRSHQLIFDVTFCGDWAGNVWSTDATCSAQASTCRDFVQNNPSAFQDTYWLINSLRVYSDNGGVLPAPSQSQPSYTQSQPTATMNSPSTLATMTQPTAGPSQNPIPTSAPPNAPTQQPLSREGLPTTIPTGLPSSNPVPVPAPTGLPSSNPVPVPVPAPAPAPGNTQQLAQPQSSDLPGGPGGWRGSNGDWQVWSSRRGGRLSKFSA